MKFNAGYITRQNSKLILKINNMKYSIPINEIIKAIKGERFSQIIKNYQNNYAGSFDLSSDGRNFEITINSVIYHTYLDNLNFAVNNKGCEIKIFIFRSNSKNECVYHNYPWLLQCSEREKSIRQKVSYEKKIFHQTLVEQGIILINLEKFTDAISLFDRVLLDYQEKIPLFLDTPTLQFPRQLKDLKKKLEIYPSNVQAIYFKKLAEIELEAIRCEQIEKNKRIHIEGLERIHGIGKSPEELERLEKIRLKEIWELEQIRLEKIRIKQIEDNRIYWKNLRGGFY